VRAVGVPSERARRGGVRVPSSRFRCPSMVKTRFFDRGVGADSYRLRFVRWPPPRSHANPRKNQKRRCQMTIDCAAAFAFFDGGGGAWGRGGPLRLMTKSPRCLLLRQAFVATD